MSVWLLGVAVSFVDGRLLVSSVGLFATAMAGSFLLGNVPDDVRGRLGLAVVVGGAAIVGGNDPRRGPGEFIFIPALFAIAWLAGFALREREAQAGAAEIRAIQAEREREESARHAVFEERVRIARELHDVVAHHVSMMGVQAGAARVVLARDRVKAQQALTAIEISSRQAVAEMNRLLGFLRQAGDRDDLAPQPGLSQLSRLAASMSDSDLTVEISVEGESRTLPATLEVSAYRIVQEALTNTLKHAGASRVDVHLRYWPHELEVEIVDDGHPNDVASASGGLGLIGMRERAAVHGGQLSTGPAAGGGFVVRFSLPISPGAR